MEIFTQGYGAILARWTHFLAGITWIGLLYYFNFVQTPSVAQFEPSARSELTRKLAPRALWWFRWSALVTVLAGIALILIYEKQENWNVLVVTRPGPQGLPILTGMGMAFIMLLNVWGVIWPNQKRIIANAERTAAGGEADPTVPDRTRRAGLASRTNVVLSIPMLFFMATSAHLVSVQHLTFTGKWVYGLIAGAIVLLFEANALVGKQGVTKKPLDTVNGAILTGFLLMVALYGLFQGVEQIS